MRQIDGQYEYFTLVEKTIKSNLADLINSAPKITTPAESLLAGCLAMVLCYVARVRLLYFLMELYHFMNIFEDQKKSSTRYEA